MHSFIHETCISFPQNHKYFYAADGFPFLSYTYNSQDSKPQSFQLDPISYKTGIPKIVSRTYSPLTFNS